MSKSAVAFIGFVLVLAVITFAIVGPTALSLGGEVTNTLGSMGF